MKLLDNLVKKLVEKSAPMQDALTAITQLAQMTTGLSKNLLDLARQQNAHHQMLAQLWSNQQLIAKRMSDSAVDTSFPQIDMHDGDAVPKKDVNKPN